MVDDIGGLLQELRPAVNRATDRRTSPVDSLVAMWEIGDLLRKRSILKPHSFGVELQRATGGIVKRPLIFRSAKIREIWSSPDEIRRECSTLKSQHNVIEMLPFLDAKQRTKYDISEAELEALRRAMVNLPSNEFFPRLRDFKKAHPSRRLGKPLDRDQYLPKMVGFADILRVSAAHLLQGLEAGQAPEDPRATQILAARLRFVAGVLGSMPPGDPKPENETMRTVAKALLESGSLTSVNKRKRLWRLFPRERLMELAEIVTAWSGPAERQAFLRNRKMAETLTPGPVPGSTNRGGL
jgi:hypothetical protein